MIFILKLIGLGSFIRAPLHIILIFIIIFKLDIEELCRSIAGCCSETEQDKAFRMCTRNADCMNIIRQCEQEAFALCFDAPVVEGEDYPDDWADNCPKNDLHKTMFWHLVRDDDGELNDEEIRWDLKEILKSPIGGCTACEDNELCKNATKCIDWKQPSCDRVLMGEIMGGVSPGLADIYSKLYSERRHKECEDLIEEHLEDDDSTVDDLESDEEDIFNGDYDPCLDNVLCKNTGLLKFIIYLLGLFILITIPFPI